MINIKIGELDYQATSSPMDARLYYLHKLFSNRSQQSLRGYVLEKSKLIGTTEFFTLPKRSKNLTLRFFTLDGSWELGPVLSIIVPGSKGQFTLFKNHINYICHTDPGIVEIYGISNIYYFVLDDFGVLRLQNNVVSIMINGIENPWSYKKEDILANLNIVVIRLNLIIENQLKPTRPSRRRRINRLFQKLFVCKVRRYAFYRYIGIEGTSG